MIDVPTLGRGVKNFAEWQPVYAERGITLIPCGPDKNPLVKNPQKFGRNGSASLAISKFSDASAFGYYCGRRNGITVLDVDTTDEKVLADAMDKHGQSPIVVRTGSGKFHALYRHNNERRAIRAWGKEKPIDLLGAGLAIAPPSVVTKGQYQIIQGHLDDLDRLPIMRELEDRLYAAGIEGPQRQGEGRNNDLWRRAMREAHHVDDFEQLLDRVETLNQEYVEPMPQCEVQKIANSAWGKTEAGDNWFGQTGVRFLTWEVNELIESSPDDYLLLSYLRANQKPDSTFWIANGLAETFGWSRQRLAATRESIIRRGYVYRLRHASNNLPALYRWTSSRGKS
jgi:hypothetical protein